LFPEECVGYASWCVGCVYSTVSLSRSSASVPVGKEARELRQQSNNQIGGRTDCSVVLGFEFCWGQEIK